MDIGSEIVKVLIGAAVGSGGTWLIASRVVVERIKVQLETQARQISQLEARADLTSRVERLEKDVGSVRKDIADVRAEVGDVRERVAGLEARVETGFDRTLKGLGTLLKRSRRAKRTRQEPPPTRTGDA